MVITGHATVPSNSTVAVFILPPGYANFTMYQPTQTQAVYINVGSGATATNGLILNNTPFNGETVVGSSGATVYATTGNATASSFNYLVSTTQ